MSVRPYRDLKQIIRQKSRVKNVFFSEFTLYVSVARVTWNSLGGNLDVSFQNVKHFDLFPLWRLFIHQRIFMMFFVMCSTPHVYFLNHIAF